MQAEYPYDEYKLYIVHHSKENRNYAVLVPLDKNSGLKRTTISYARYLMSVKLKRFLKEEETVDHIDNDKTHDIIENLQVLSGTENRKKYHKTLSHKMVLLKCPMCGELFIKRRKQTHLSKKDSIATFCSRHCSSQYGTMVQHNKITREIQENIKNNVIIEFEEFNR